MSLYNPIFLPVLLFFNIVYTRKNPGGTRLQVVFINAIHSWIAAPGEPYYWLIRGIPYVKRPYQKSTKPASGFLFYSIQMCRDRRV
ncbi:MAG: hypothetical protein Q8941_15045 [Bacteroidota bacterium]|nr:hypothetical protein [Bacteroidota bacterium]